MAYATHTVVEDTEMEASKMKRAADGLERPEGEGGLRMAPSREPETGSRWGQPCGGSVASGGMRLVRVALPMWRWRPEESTVHTLPTLNDAGGEPENPGAKHRA